MLILVELFRCWICEMRLELEPDVRMASSLPAIFYKWLNGVDTVDCTFGYVCCFIPESCRRDVFNEGLLSVYLYDWIYAVKVVASSSFVLLVSFAEVVVAG